MRSLLILEICVESADCNQVRINALGNESFLEEGVVDSTGIMQLVSYLQEQYLITIEDEELIPDNLDSIRKVMTFIEVKRQAKPQSGAA